MTAAYKYVPDFPGYRVDTDGVVCTCWQRKGPSGTYVMTDFWRRLAGSKDKDGYRKVIFCCNGRRKHALVHRLVLELFVGPPPPGTEAAHENNIRDDNRLINLRWATHSDNVADKLRHGTHQAGEKHGRAILTADQARQIKARKGAGRPARIVAADFHVSIQTVYAIWSGRLWKTLTKEGK